MIWKLIFGEWSEAPPPKFSEKHFSRVVDTLETSIEHFASLMYSAERKPRY
jgi:hypothetical protein